MTKHTKLVDTFIKVNDNYTVTNCNNGFVVVASGQNSSKAWITVKFVIKTIGELNDVFQDLACMSGTSSIFVKDYHYKQSQ